MAYKQITGAVVVLFLGLFLGLIFSEGALAQANRDGDRTEGQISFGFDGQNYSTGRTSSIASMDATIRLLPRLTLETVATGGVYFGQRFGGGASYVTMMPDAKTYLTAGGSRDTNTSTTAEWSASFEVGRTLYRSGRSAIRRAGAIRALETDLNVTERGYHLSPSVHILMVNPSAIVYLPRDWSLALRAGAIRETIAGASTWTPAGGAKLNIPLTRRLSISPSVAFDSELSNVLQINNVSSREFGTGVHFWLTRNASVGGYYFRVLYGANHLASDSYGVSYALRF
jgi:hypothetical protein